MALRDSAGIEHVTAGDAAAGDQRQRVKDDGDRSMAIVVVFLEVGCIAAETCFGFARHVGERVRLIVTRRFRHPSRSIGSRRLVFSVILTVKLSEAPKNFSDREVLRCCGTIEWE